MDGRGAACQAAPFLFLECKTKPVTEISREQEK